MTEVKPFILTKPFEVHPESNCKECKSRGSYRLGRLGNFSGNYICLAFDSWLEVRTIENGMFPIPLYKPCQRCIEFVAKQKSKVFCRGCNKFYYELGQSSDCDVYGCENESNEVTYDGEFYSIHTDFFCYGCTEFESIPEQTTDELELYMNEMENLKDEHQTH